MAELTATADAAVSNKARDRARHQNLEHGNYPNYYFHRQQSVPDARLSLLPVDLFKQKRILDLGCNAGKITIETMTYLGAQKATGVDIDQILIDQARAQPDSDKVEWQCRDFTQPGAIARNEWDTILLLSVTKWLHLHAGDEGLRALFRTLFEALPSGGTLVVEPQERENYAKAARKNKNLRPVFQSIQMWPPFEDDLNAIGFELIETIPREEGGFSRPLMLWRKPPAE
ncbi:hypothetical protein OIO90_002718 [Microbotryomycetes sp. JL221]|nr:hypothetical protein OIO90_002718 [Microbotryomycetes sp. JL221]